MDRVAATAMSVQRSTQSVVEVRGGRQVVRIVPFLLAALALGSSTATRAQPAPERIVFFTTFQHGLSGWSGTPDKWRVTSHFITADVRGSSVLIAPFAVPHKNYAVQSKFQIVAWRNRGSEDATVGLLFRAPRSVDYNMVPGKESPGLIAGPYRRGATTRLRVKQPYERGAILSVQSRYNPGTGFHTYRVEVRGSHIRVLVDGHQSLSFWWSQPVAGSHVGIVVSNAAVQVKGFRVTTL